MSFVKVLLSRPEDDLDISTAQEDVAVAEARVCGCAGVGRTKRRCARALESM